MNTEWNVILRYQNEINAIARDLLSVKFPTMDDIILGIKKVLPGDPSRALILGVLKSMHAMHAQERLEKNNLTKGRRRSGARK